MTNFFVRLVCELIDGQESLFCIERKMTRVVVREIKSLISVADDKELNETEQRFGVTVTRIVLVFSDLLHSPTRIHAESLQLDLNTGHTIDEDEYIVAVVAVVSVDAKLPHNLEMVF